ncbi:SHOCT domain-containing protein [Kitasatospora purpeofusca]|uniref:SHOCT domain-containing protein n=1 Tax=Kitasatospora purpeofusca TaxID=67352 RepID=A0ABZ1U6A1_9ACTN|nr:SHOCT domain-containing protein [Kitasatospora purpeofusca]
MDWSDLIDTAFDVAGNSSSDHRAAALRTVEANVAPDEKPVASTAGRHPDHFRKGVLVLTTHRLLFLKDGKPPVPVPLSAVTDATVTRTRINGEVLLVVALTGSHRFEDVVKAEVFAEQLRAAARLAREATRKEPVAAAPAATGADLLDQLERLAALHTAGALTAEEFTRAKQRLIG